VTPVIPGGQKDYQKASYQLLVDLFIEGISKGTKLPISGNDGLLISEVTEAFYKSYTSQKEVLIK
jgi:hypothetical protein